MEGGDCGGHLEIQSDYTEFRYVIARSIFDAW